VGIRQSSHVFADLSHCDNVRIYSLSSEEKKSVSFFIGAFLPKTKLVQQFQVKQRRQNVLKVK